MQSSVGVLCRALHASSAELRGLALQSSVVLKWQRWGVTKFELSLPTRVSWKEDLLGFCYPFNFTTQKKKEKCGIFLGLTWTTIPPKPHSSKTISHLSDIQKQTQLFPNISSSLLNLNVFGKGRFSWWCDWRRDCGPVDINICYQRS